MSREAQDTYALQSQQRTAAAQERGLFKEEIVSFTNLRPGGERVTLDLDEGSRRPRGKVSRACPLSCPIGRDIERR